MTNVALILLLFRLLEHPAVAEAGGWPRVVKTSAPRTEQPSKAVHRRKTIANADPVVTASIAKKKRKAQTAKQNQTSFSVWR